MPLRFSVLKNTTINMEKMLCIQSTVEKPSLYIIGRCLSNDQQLLYFHIRLEDISLIRENLKTSDGIPVRNKMPIFKGYSPARQFEAGQQTRRIFFLPFLQYSREFLGKSSISLQAKSLSLQFHTT